MALKFKPLSEQVIVITGASSGIGLATAYAASKKGAKVVLASRNEPALAEIAGKIKAAGGRAHYVVADVSSREDLQKVADEAIFRFGSFDTWINNAGTSIVGRLDEVDDEDHHRLFEINFWGVVYGSLIALDHLKLHGGALINIGSQVSDAAIPLQGMYSATKHAVKGFTDALRLETEKEKHPISITLIKPASTGTPLFEHAKNYTIKAPKAPSPTYRPEEVANAILHAATHRVRDFDVGGVGKLRNIIYTLMPRFMDKVYKKAMFEGQLGNEKRRQDGTLYHAGEDGHVNGKTGGRRHISLYARAKIHPVAATVTGVSIALAAAGAGVFIKTKLNDKKWLEVKDRGNMK